MAKKRPLSPRSIRDNELLAEVVRVHAENIGVYAADNMIDLTHEIDTQ